MIGDAGNHPRRGGDLESARQTRCTVACGGVGKFEDFVDGIKIGKASAVAAGNIFNFTEISAINAKKLMRENGIEVRT